MILWVMATVTQEHLIKIQEYARSIESELKKLNAHKLIRVYNSWWRFILYQLAKGIAFGLGSVLGATLVVSIVVFILSQLEVFPGISGWIQEAVNMIENYQSSQYGHGHKHE